MTTESGPGFLLETAPRRVFGSFVDCNLAEAWVGQKLRIFPGKYGEDPVWGEAHELKYADGCDAEQVFATPAEGFTEVCLPANAPVGSPGLHGAIWFETMVSSSPDGSRLHALYHNENYPQTLPWNPETCEGYKDESWPPGLLGEGSAQAVCRIGIMASTDGGKSWSDKGIILEDLYQRLVTNNQNHTFPGGVGDPSAVPCTDHLYIFFGEYGYPQHYDPGDWDPALEADSQCISVARLPLSKLDDPVGAARRWDGQGFNTRPDQAGLPIRSLQIPFAEGGGPVSSESGGFFWGPSVSWNTYLECWVMVMAKVEAGFWKGDSVWISFNPHPDLGVGANSQDWSAPGLLLREPGETLWYPSLQPLASAEDVAAHHTCTRLGRTVRLWVKRADAQTEQYRSEHLITFTK